MTTQARQLLLRLIEISLGCSRSQHPIIGSHKGMLIEIFRMW